MLSACLLVLFACLQTSGLAKPAMQASVLQRLWCTLFYACRAKGYVAVRPEVMAMWLLSIGVSTEAGAVQVGPSHAAD